MNTKNKIYPAHEVLKKYWQSLTFGQYLKDMRESDEITQTELAKRLGVKRQYIQAVEIGKTNVSPEMAKRIAECLGYFPEPFIEVLLNEMVRKIGIKKSIKFYNPGDQAA